VHCKGGVNISFLVKPSHVSKLEKGINLFNLSLPKNQRKRVLFKEFTLYTDPTITSRELFDQIWICTDSTALLDSDFFSALLSKVDPNKTVLVNSTPESDDDELLLAFYKSRDRLIHTTISFQSWQAPLPDEKIHPTLLFYHQDPTTAGQAIPQAPGSQGIAYYQAPFVSVPFGGRDIQTIKQIITILNKGGLQSKETLNPVAETALISSIFTPMVIGLEKENWSFKQFALSSTISTATKAAGENLQLAATKYKKPALAYARFLLFSIFFRVIFLVTPYFLNVDSEAFVKYHFTKVGKQIKMSFDKRIETAQKYGISTTQMQQLKFWKKY